MKEESFASVWKKFIRRGEPSVDFITPFSTFRRREVSKKIVKRDKDLSRCIEL